MKLSADAKLLLSLFIPFYAIHCMHQVYFVYGSALQKMGYSATEIGPLLGSLFVAVMLARPVGSWFIEKLGIRTTLIAAGIFAFIGSTILLFARGVQPILAGRLLMGLSFGVYTMGVFAYQSIVTPDSIRGASFSIVVAGGMLPMATVAPLGDWFLLHDMLTGYLLIGPISALFCIYFGCRVRGDVKASDEKPRVWGTYRELFKYKRFILLTGASVLIGLVDASAINMSIFATEKNLIVSYYLISSAVAALLVRLAGARILNRLPRQKYLLPFGMILPASLFFMAVFPSNAMLTVAGFIFGLGIGAAWPILLSITSDILPTELRPKGTAVTVLLYDSCWFMTPFLIGIFSGYFSMARSYVLLSLFCFSGQLLLYFLFWRPAYRQ